MSDTALFSYARRLSINQGSNQELEEWWTRATSAITTGDTISATLTLVGGGAHHSNIIAVGFSGIGGGSTPFDPNTGLPKQTGAGSGQPTVTGVATSNANDIIVAMVGSNGPNSDTAGGALFLVASQNQNSEVGSVEYGTLSSTLAGATFTFDTGTTTQSHWVMMVDALVRVSAQVAQPVTITTIGTGISAATSVSNCNVTPTSISADGAQLTLAADPSCTLTFTVPSDTSSARYRFSNTGTPSTTWTVAVCATGTCTPQSNNVYFQRIQTLSYSVSGGGSPIPPTFTATQLGSSFGQVLTTTATGYWFDNGASWSVADPITGATGEKWQIDTGSQADTGTISSAQTIAFTYIHQFFFTVSSTQDTPTPVSGWFNAGSSLTESVSTPVSGGTDTQYLTTGWTGTGSVPATGASDSVTFTLNTASSIIWNWQLQYLLTIQTSGLASSHPTAVYLNGVSSGTASDTAPFTVWLNAGASTGTMGVDAAISGGPGVGYFFVQWDDSSTLNPRTSVSMSAPVTRTATFGADSTPPVIVPTVTPSPNVNGWNTGSVTVSWSVSDPESGVASSSGCGTTILTSETGGTAIACTATNGAGLTGSVSVTVKIDKTNPVVTSSRSPSPNANGWNNGNVTVTFSCSDTLSGVATGPTSPQIVSSEGTGQSSTATCTDNAGNTGSATVTNINIDRTPPVIASSRSASPNSNGWNNVTVTVSFTCSDVLSGVSSVPPPSTLSEGGGQSVTGTCLDNAGNSASSTQSNINVDLTNPVISSSRSVGPNSSGWNNVPVTVSFSCSDALSGVSTSSSPTTLGQGALQLVTGTCTDLAGNSASATESGINVDLTPPTVTSSRSVQPNINGWNNVPVTISFACSDALSGVSSFSSPTTLGEGNGQSVTGNCTDRADNAASTTETNINIDLTVPLISGSRSPGANSFGWNNASVTVSFTCTDTLSGVGSLSTPTVLDTEGAQSVNGICVDQAGNSAAATVTSINIDLTQPTVTSSRSVQPNINGWNNVPLTVSFSCTDTLSGTNSTSGPTTLGQGSGQSVTGTCTDRAGNSASTTATNINIDLTSPTITGSLSPSPNATGWVNSSATVNFTCFDSLSGVAFCSPPTSPSSEGFGQSVTGFVTDLAGNNASATVSNINIDKTLPTITGSPSPSANADGWNNVAVTVNFACTDGLSGVASYSNSSTVSAEGAGQSVIGTCTDIAGNTASATVGNINIDLANPTITGHRNPPPDIFGGSFGPVTVTFTCTDALSGVANVTSPVTVGNGQGQSVSGSCTDKAGNQVSARVTGINVGVNTSLLLILILIIVAALSTISLAVYKRKRRHKFIWDLPAQHEPVDPVPKGGNGKGE